MARDQTVKHTAKVRPNELGRKTKNIHGRAIVSAGTTGRNYQRLGEARVRSVGIRRWWRAGWVLKIVIHV